MFPCRTRFNSAAPKLANSISYLGAGFLRALEVSGLEKRLEALEQAQKFEVTP